MKSEIEILCEQLRLAVEALPDDIMPFDIQYARWVKRFNSSLESACNQMAIVLQPAISAIQEFGQYFGMGE